MKSASSNTTGKSKRSCAQAERLSPVEKRQRSGRGARRERQFIVKVQISLFPEGRLMVYNEKRDIFFEGEATPEIIKTMRGEFKKFFIAELIRKKIVLIKPTNWQDW